jgi:hypothetical protein
MKRYKKYRLAFDALALLGLLLLVLYYWYGHPSPQWRVPINSANTQVLGFSSDNQKAYCIKDLIDRFAGIPKPILQHWDIAKGKLESEQPLQLPPEDETPLFPYIMGTPTLTFKAQLVQKNLLCVETPIGTRFYNVENGQCLSKKNMKVSWIDYLVLDSKDRHYYGVADCSNAQPDKAVLYDLVTGEVLRTIEHGSAQALEQCRLSADNQNLLLVWQRKPDDTRSRSFELEIIDLNTWKSIMRLPLDASGMCCQVNPNSLMQISYFIDNAQPKNRLRSFRLDYPKGKLEQDKSNPLLGLVCNETMTIQNDFLILHGVRSKNQSRLPWKERVSQFFEDLFQHGKLPEVVAQQDYFIYDIKSGKQLRQLTGITAYGRSAICISHDARHLLGKEYFDDWHYNNQAFLTLYEIPNYWWEKSWAVTFYSALILLFLWPARFLARKPA